MTTVHFPTYDEFPAVPQRWLGYPYIARDVMTLAAGGCGILKGTSMAGVIADITRGRDLFGGNVRNEVGEPALVITITPEDRSRQAMKFRLAAAGCDDRLVVNLTYDRQDPKDATRALKWKLDALGLENVRLAAAEKTAERGVPLGMVYIDPLKQVVRGVSTNDQYRDFVVDPLDALAEELGAAVFIQNHLTKEGSIAGSQGLVDAARLVLMYEPSETNPEVIKTLRVFKSNIGPKNGVPVLRYCEADPDSDWTRRVVWEPVHGVPVRNAERKLVAVPDTARGPIIGMDLTNLLAAR